MLESALQLYDELEELFLELKKAEENKKDDTDDNFGLMSIFIQVARNSFYLYVSV